MSIRWVAVLTLVVLLTGCEDPKGYNQLMLHPESVSKVYADCQRSESNQGDKSGAEQCVAVRRACHELAIQLTNALFAGQRYGATILALQSKLVEQERKLRVKQSRSGASNTPDGGVERIRQLSQDYNQHLAVIRVSKDRKVITGLEVCARG